MKTTGKTPLEVERKLLSVIFPDFILIMFIFGFVFSAGIIYSGMFDLVSSMIAIAMLLFIAALMGFVRFFRFFSTGSRMLGAFQSVYEGFGSGEVQVSLSCPLPLVLIKLTKDVEFSETDEWKISMTSQSDTYTVQAEASVDHPNFEFSLSISDWHGTRHQADVSGRIAEAKSKINGIVDAIKSKVVQGKGAPSPQEHEPNLKQALKELKKIDKGT